MICLTILELLLCKRNFPNLKALYFESCNVTPDEFISDLTSLEYLQTLGLNNMPNLGDVAFTKECVEVNSNRNNSEQSVAEVVTRPAIASFKSLKKLRLLNCPKLTNECVINGIAHSRTLQKLEMRGCKITVECLQENFIW